MARTAHAQKVTQKGPELSGIPRRLIVADSPIDLTFTFIKSATDAKSKKRYVDAYVACGGPARDIGNDIFHDEPIAFIAAELEKHTTVLWQHEIDVPVGHITEVKVVEENGSKKVWCRIVLIHDVKVPIGDPGDTDRPFYDLWTLISEGHIKKCSVRYKVAKGGAHFDDEGNRHITELEAVIEASFVAVGMNQGADVLNFFEAKRYAGTKSEMKQVGAVFGSGSLENVTDDPRGRMFSALIDVTGLDGDLTDVFAKSLKGKPIYLGESDRSVGEVLSAEIEQGHIVVVGVAEKDVLDAKGEKKHLKLASIAQITEQKDIARLSQPVAMLADVEKKDASAAEKDAEAAEKAETAKQLATEINELREKIKTAEGAERRALRADIDERYEQFCDVTGTTPSHPLAKGFEGDFPPAETASTDGGDEKPAGDEAKEGDEKPAGDPPAETTAEGAASGDGDQPPADTGAGESAPTGDQPPAEGASTTEQKNAKAAVARTTEKKSARDYAMAWAWSLVDSVDCFADGSEADETVKAAFKAAADTMRAGLGKPKTEAKGAGAGLATTEVKGAPRAAAPDPFAAIKALEKKSAEALATATSAMKKAEEASKRNAKLETEVKSAKAEATAAREQTLLSQRAAAQAKAALSVFQKRAASFTHGPQGGAPAEPAEPEQSPFQKPGVLPGVWEDRP